LPGAGCGVGATASPPSEAPDTEAEATIAFEHSAGTTDVPVDPQRIVTTTDQNALLPLLELGVEPVASAGLVGDDGSQSFRRVDGYDTSAVEFVGAYGEPNLEAMAAQRPDLILGYEIDESYEELSQLSPDRAGPDLRPPAHRGAGELRSARRRAGAGPAGARRVRGTHRRPAGAARSRCATS